MDAKTLAAEIETTINATWKMWSKEATVGANGALVISPDLPAKFFKAQANNFAMAYADRIVPSCEANMDPADLFAQATVCFAMVAEVSAITDDNHLDTVINHRAQQAEMLQVIAASGSGAYATTLMVVCEHLNHCDRLIAKYKAAVAS